MYQLYHKYEDRLYQLYQQYKNRDSILLIPFVLLAFYKIVGHFFWLLLTGRGLPQSDDGKWYINYANTFVINLTDGLDMNDILYFGYNSLLTILLTVFKDPAAVIFIQAVTASLSVILVYKIAYLLFNRTTAIIASLFYCITYDFTLWAMYILSDSFFVSLLLLCIYFLLMALHSADKKYKILFAATSLYMLIFRPTGIVTLLFIFVYVLLQLDRNILSTFVKKHRWLIGGFITVAFAGIAYLYMGNKLDPFIASMQFNAKKVLYNIYAKGWIYDKPSSYDYFFRPNYAINICDSLIISFIINNWDHVSILYVRRAVAFLGRWAWETEIKSVADILRFAFQFVPTALFIIGTIAAITNKLFRKALIMWLIILGVFAFCVLFFIDWMYRYKLPALPFIAIVAAYGAERIINGVLINSKKITEMLSYGQRKNTGCHPGF